MWSRLEARVENLLDFPFVIDEMVRSTIVKCHLDSHRFSKQWDR